MVQGGVIVVRPFFCLSPCAWIAKETFHEVSGRKNPQVFTSTYPPKPTASTLKLAVGK